MYVSLTPLSRVPTCNFKNILNWLEISFYSLWKNNCDYHIHNFSIKCSIFPLVILFVILIQTIYFLYLPKYLLLFAFLLFGTLSGMVFHFFFDKHLLSFLTGNAWRWTSLLRLCFSEKCLNRILEIHLLNVEFQIRGQSFQCSYIFSFAAAAAM